MVTQINAIKLDPLPEMYRIEGVIYVWSYKGEIYIRKAGEKNPRIKISCEEDLNKLRKGEISLDAPSDEIQVNSPRY